MLTDEDIQKLLTVLETRFATKKDLTEALDNNTQSSLKLFATKQDHENLRTELRQFKDEILTALDAYAKEASAYFQEAEQANIKLQY